MTTKIKPNIYYQEEITIFGKIICAQCGIDHNLRHVQLSCLDENGKIKSIENVLCTECLSNLPSYENESEV